MYEYKVMAYFTSVYGPRSYKNKIVTTEEEAKELLEKAYDYYSTYKYFDRVVIVKRKVTEWEEI